MNLPVNFLIKYILHVKGLLFFIVTYFSCKKNKSYKIFLVFVNDFWVLHFLCIYVKLELILKLK